MKRQWQIRRTTVTQVNGQQCWDRVFQNLLQWTCAPPAPIDQAKPLLALTQEVSHASSDLCAGIDLSSGSGPDH